MSPVVGRESQGFDLSFTQVPTTGAACNGFSIDHFRAVLKEGSEPTDQFDGLAFDGTAALTLRVLPHRADREYHVRLFACDNLLCTDVYGDIPGDEVTGSDAAKDEVEVESTDPEEWLIESRAASDPGLGSTAVQVNAHDVEVLTIPVGWTGAGKLAIFAWDHDAANLSVSVALTSGTGWTNYNTTTWGGATQVAGSAVNLTDYTKVNHPFVVAHLDGATKRYRMMAQNEGIAGDNHQVWVDSNSNTPLNFSLSGVEDCDGSSSSVCDWSTRATAGYAGVAFATGSGTAWTSALHGRWMWDYLGSGPVNLASDAPLMVFSGEPDGTTCADAGDDSADIYLATWNPFTSSWVVYDGPDTDSCPDAIVTDAHDPAVTPLPAGEFKMYTIDTLNHDIRIDYYDGTQWESSSATVSILWDDTGYTPVDQDCIANMATVARLVSGTGREGMFMYVAQDGVEFEEQDCDEGSSFTPGDGSRVYFAELQN